MKKSAQVPTVVPVERTGTLPLSFAQERLWFIDRLEPESAAYNVSVVWRVGGALDEAEVARESGLDRAGLESYASPRRGGLTASAQ